MKKRCSFVGARLLGSHIDRIQGVIFGSVYPSLLSEVNDLRGWRTREKSRISNVLCLNSSLSGPRITDLFEHVYHVKSHNLRVF